MIRIVVMCHAAHPCVTTKGLGDTTWVRKAACGCYIQDSMGLDVTKILGPLVWKTRNNFRNAAVKRISDFQKRWGNSGSFDWFAAD